MTIDVVTGEARPWEPGPVISNNFGFGGHNGSVVIAPAPDSARFPRPSSRRELPIRDGTVSVDDDEEQFALAGDVAVDQRAT